MNTDKHGLDQCLSVFIRVLKTSCHERIPAPHNVIREFARDSHV